MVWFSGPFATLTDHGSCTSSSFCHMSRYAAIRARDCSDAPAPPACLPPRVKGFKKPVWSRKTVASWIESREEEKPQAKPIVRPKRVVQNGPPRRNAF